MRLYHGSNMEIGEIDLAMSKPNKDFGRGFYLTEDRRQALALAHQRVLRTGGCEFVNEYDFDESLLRSGLLNVKMFNGYTEDWADFVLRNRTDSNYSHDYDIVVGPIADDKVGLQVRLCLDGLIDISMLVNRLKYTHVTMQYFFGTSAAIKNLIRV